MSIGGRVFARIYDPLMSATEAAGLRARRRELIAQAKGEVLEVGGGTGANLPMYRDTVDALTLTEPEQPMLNRLQRRVRETGTRARVLRAPAEDLPFLDGTFDVVVSTLVLCTVADQPRAAREVRRVLRPGGRLLFIEHVRADDVGLARWQDRLNGIHRVLGHGCNCNRPTLQTLTSNGFRVLDVDHGTMPRAVPWIRPLIIGSAEAVDR